MPKANFILWLVAIDQAIAAPTMVPKAWAKNGKIFVIKVWHDFRQCLHIVQIYTLYGQNHVTNLNEGHIHSAATNPSKDYRQNISNYWIQRTFLVAIRTL